MFCNRMTSNGAMAVVLRFFSPNSVALGADYVKVIEDNLCSLQPKCSPTNLVFSDISFMAIFADVTENERNIERHLRDIHPLYGLFLISRAASGNSQHLQKFADNETKHAESK